MENPAPSQDVQSRIYRIRGQQVMLSLELASLYRVQVRVLVQAVKRNSERFPRDFMFQLSFDEWNHLKSQIVTSSWGGTRRAPPYAFTEQGIAMLSSVLRSREAIQVNIAIMRAFIKLRHAVLAHQAIARRVEKLEGKVEMHDTDIRFIAQDVERLKKRPGPSGPINPSIL
jgi:hypothetical protein